MVSPTKCQFAFDSHHKNGVYFFMHLDLFEAGKHIPFFWLIIKHFKIMSDHFILIHIKPVGSINGLIRQAGGVQR